MRLTYYDLVKIKQEKANVFVKNLGGEETNISLYNLFKAYGEIFSSKLAQDLKGKSKGYGFVQYTSPEIALRVVTEMNGKEHNERKLVVAPYKSKHKGGAPSLFNNLYIKNLPPSVTTKESLDALFASFGERTSIVISQSELKGKIGYFGFVCYKNPEDAVKAVQEMNGKSVEGSSLFVVMALPKEQREREKRKMRIELRLKNRRLTLYVKSATGEPLTEELIKQELKDFGSIKQVNVQTRKTNEGTIVNLPVAFVIFEREEDILKVNVNRVTMLRH